MAVNLSKGQKVSLKKESGAGLQKVFMGLGWDVAEVKGVLWGSKPGAPIDLDASCVMFDASGKAVDTVWFRQLKSRDGSVAHSGDNRTGEGEGDDERIMVDLTKVPANVTALVFTVNSFTGETFSRVKNAFCRLVDAQANQEIARYDLSCQGNHTGQIMAKVYRDGGEWKMQALGENGYGRTIDELLPAIRNHLA